MSIKVTKFIWEDIGIWDEIKRSFSKFFLHTNHIVTETVLSGDFIWLREVIDFLELVQSFIKITLARRRAPKDVPFMRLCVTETIAFKYWTQKLVIKTEHLIKKLWIFNVVRLLSMITTSREIWMGRYHLIFFNIFEWNELIFSNSVSVISI